MEYLKTYESFSAGDTYNVLYHEDGWILGILNREIKRVEDFNIIKDMKFLFEGDFPINREWLKDNLQDFKADKKDTVSWGQRFVWKDEDELEDIYIKFTDKNNTKAGNMKVKQDFLSMQQDLSGFKVVSVFAGITKDDDLGL